jgi:hypothetical protein
MTITFPDGMVVEASDGLLIVALVVLAPTIFTLAETISACVKHLIRDNDAD